MHICLGQVHHPQAWIWNYQENKGEASSNGWHEPVARNLHNSNWWEKLAIERIAQGLEWDQEQEVYNFK